MTIDNTINENTNTWVLAERMAGHNTVHEQSLKKVFEGIVLGIKEKALSNIEQSTIDAAWNKLSPTRLKILKDTFLLNFCKSILNNFKPNEIDEMLDEHKKNGIIKQPKYSAALQVSYAFNQNLVVMSVINKTTEMANELVKEMVEEMTNSGVKFPQK